jgi:hypothetical protein
MGRVDPQPFALQGGNPVSTLGNNVRADNEKCRAARHAMSLATGFS